ncbi:helix-turn-helix transcriptional regulator [Streptomyces acidicola]|uniref:Helix-turn-helix domain-containing protein n=1 Tax=Streptomyces acidicola TaxID=2596892 RepID=A0A5N8WS78_9ACTN|nr:helix-turn-helix transcriptional regulator [Streptomyces acidicola]MPY50243.1 helix-turn-helix domain-containing protein [Streptomyces acidicola]
MLKQPQMFGPELRRLRLAAGLTLTQLASSVHYSKGQLSKIETGQKRPTAEFARLCDAALDAGGALSALVPVAPRRTRSSVRDQEGSMSPPDSYAHRIPGEHPEGHPGGHPGGSSWSPPSRRQMMAAGAASVLGVRAGERTPVPSAPSEADSLTSAYRELLGQYRRIGQMSPPGTLLPVLAEQTRALQTLSAHGDTRVGRDLLALSARFAEFTGWMAQEAGDDTAALRWTDHAVDLATASGDEHLAQYALVRRALVSYYRGAAAETIDLVDAALSDRLPPRIRGLAAQRRAQGHALDGNYDACMRSLEQARVLLARAAAEASTADAPVLGTTHLDDPVSMITGWCLLDLGRPAQAAAVLDQQCARLSAGAFRTRARYGARRALAHAIAGEIDHACELTADLLATTASVGSATIATDLRRLSRALCRHASRPACRAIAPQLTAALAPDTR